MLPDRPFRRDLCESAKKGNLCIDDLCHGGGETLCGFDAAEYEEMLSDEEWEDAVCTCDFDEPENCLAHYPIDDGSDDDGGGDD